MLALQSVYGDDLVRRCDERIARGEHDLAAYRPLLWLHYSHDARGDLAFDEVEALFCEGKDAVLTAAGVRHREHRTAHFAAFPLDALPMRVAAGNRHRLVTVDMSPARWNDAAWFAHVCIALRQAIHELEKA